MKNNKGEIYVLVTVFILVLMMIFSVIFTFTSIVTEVKVQRTNTKIVFDSFVAKNSILIYSNIKQGNNATDGVNGDSFRTQLKSFCTLEEHGGKLYSISADGTEKFSISIPEVGHTQDGKLELYTTYEMYVPIYFAGHIVTTARVPITVTSELSSKN